MANFGPDWMANVQPVVKLLHAGHTFGGVVGDVLHLTGEDGPFQSDFAARYQHLDIIGVNLEVHRQPIEHIVSDALIVSSGSGPLAVEHAHFHVGLLSKVRAES